MAIIVLTEDMVIEARRMYATQKWTHLQLGREMGIDKSTLRNAIVGQTWGSLPYFDTMKCTNCGEIFTRQINYQPCGIIDGICTDCG